MRFLPIYSTLLATIVTADRVKLRVQGEGIDSYIEAPRPGATFLYLLLGTEGNEFRFSENTITETTLSHPLSMGDIYKALSFEYQNPTTFLVNDKSELVADGSFWACKMYCGLIECDISPILFLEDESPIGDCIPISIKVEVVAEDVELAIVSKNCYPPFDQPLGARKLANNMYYLAGLKEGHEFVYQDKKLTLMLPGYKDEILELNASFRDTWMVLSPDVEGSEVTFDKNGSLVLDKKIWACQNLEDPDNLTEHIVRFGEQPKGFCVEVSIVLRNTSNNKQVK